MSKDKPQLHSLVTIADDVEYQTLTAAIKASFLYSGSKEEIEKQASLDWDNIRNLLREYSSVTYKGVKFQNLD